MPSAEIVAIGSELLLGQIVDTNSAWMAERLTNLGIDLYYKTVVGDNPDRMRGVIDRALERSDVVICGGGLGPTQDDITREIIAQVANRELVLDERLRQQMYDRFQRRGFILTPNNERQAYIPEGSTPVDNPNGTAPSFIVEDPRGVIFALPGVPFELKWLFDNEVVPYLRRRFELTEVISYKVLKVAEIGESNVDDRIGHLMARAGNPTVGVLAHPGQVDVRIAAKAGSLDEAAELIAPVEREVRDLLGKHVFAVDDETMEDAVGNLLRAQDQTIAVYEDITGGLLADRLQEAGNDRFVEGVVGSGPESARRLLSSASPPADIDTMMDDPAAVADGLATSVMAWTGSSLGLALHAEPDPGDSAENLARGRMHISVTDGTGYRRRTYNSAGRGRPDRTRMSLNGADLVRVALLEGF